MTDFAIGEMFTGFDGPQQNYTNIPIKLIEALPLFKTLAEMKVVIYVLRHTWGYQEYDEGKRITLDEFQYGRKRRDGTRIDPGIGMVKNSINDGIDNAVKHGFLCVETDESDPARIKKYYSLRGVKDCTPEGQTLTPRGSDIDPRTEINTLDTNLKIENTLPIAPSASADAEPTPDDLAHFLQEQALEKDTPPGPPPPPLIESVAPDGFVFAVSDYGPGLKHLLRGGKGRPLCKATPFNYPQSNAVKLVGVPPCAECLRLATAPKGGGRKPSSDLTDAMHNAIPADIRPPGKPHYGKHSASADVLHTAGFTPERITAYVKWAYEHDEWLLGAKDNEKKIITMYRVWEKITAYESGGLSNGGPSTSNVNTGSGAQISGGRESATGQNSPQASTVSNYNPEANRAIRDSFNRAQVSNMRRNEGGNT